MSNVGYNEEWVKSVTLDEFLKACDHLKTLTYLQGDYERITGRKAKMEEPSKEDNKEG